MDWGAAVMTGSAPIHDPTAPQARAILVALEAFRGHDIDSTITQSSVYSDMGSAISRKIV